MNENLKTLFEKASADKDLKNRIISIYREYTAKDEIIDQLIILASEYGIILKPDDFRKQSESDMEYVSSGDFENTGITDLTDIPDNTPEETRKHKKSFFGKLFGKK